ncbi:hypothetical protein DPMN_163830, partial [Dreissena polymorpha]
LETTRDFDRCRETLNNWKEAVLVLHEPETPTQTHFNSQEIRHDVHQQIQMNTKVATVTRKSLRLSH